jgi:hypothetical protein
LVDKSVVHDDSFVLEETVNLMKKYDSYIVECYAMADFKSNYSPVVRNRNITV